MQLRRLPIIYDIPNGTVLENPFYKRMGEFDDPYDEFVDICLNNLTWGAYHLLMWKGKPLELAPFQSIILETLWNKTFPILLMTRGGGKTFMLAVYACMRAMLTPGAKIVIVASSFRQSKLVFEYIENLYNYSPILRAACPRGIEKPSDSRRLIVGDSFILALPLGNGEKIRGIRATHIITDEFASIPPEIFQVVVRGFAAVAADPIAAAKKRHAEDVAIREGRLKPEERSQSSSNQIIYSGTANFQFNHFYKLFVIHLRIIQSKFIGNAESINDTFEIEDDEEVRFEGDLDYRDYAIIRVPYQGMPHSFMDEKQIAQAKATMPKNLFQMEYECVFPTDSDGFYKRSLINRATPGLLDSLATLSIELSGQKGFQYVMGVDPARKTDNFSISILKLMGDNKYRNVYCYSMRNKSWPKAVAKIRELLKKFNIVRMSVDSGGGGTTVEDLLQDPSLIGQGDRAIWRYDEDEHIKYEGDHILDMVNFTPGWIGEANYGLASDIEHRRILFPYRSSTNETISEAHEEDETWDEIEEQIKEMCMITVSPTKTGIQHFDIPDLPTSQQATLKSYQRKDRYSAILLAAHAARSYLTEEVRTVIPNIGGWASML